MLGVVRDVHLLEGYGTKRLFVRDKRHVHPPCARWLALSENCGAQASPHTKSTLPYRTISVPQAHGLWVIPNRTGGGKERHNGEDRKEDVQAGTSACS